MRDQGGGVVTIYVWRVAWGEIGQPLRSVALDRRRVRAADGVRFAKLLGTSRDFSPRHADLTRWLLIIDWADRRAAARFDRHPVISAWTRRAKESWQATLSPIQSRGEWGRRRPFAPGTQADDGPIVAITRARISPLQTIAFWRSSGRVASAAGTQPGLRTAFGIGEAPVGIQGTFSVWDDVAAMRSFSHGAPAHRQVVAETARRNWYAEDLFAHFAVSDSSGTIDDVNPAAA
jgi:hypothetical protein